MDKKMRKVAEEDFSDLDFRSTPQGGVVLPLDNVGNRRMVETCYKTHTTTINPIVDWSNDDVWEFIKEYNVPYCCLYDEGFKRLGCIGCPMGSKKQREEEFRRWPKYKHLYLLAFEKMIENRGGTVRATDRTEYQNQTAEDIMQGYMTERFKKEEGGVSQKRLASPTVGADSSGMAERWMEGYSESEIKRKVIHDLVSEVRPDFKDMTPEEVIDWWID